MKLFWTGYFLIGFFGVAAKKCEFEKVRAFCSMTANIMMIEECDDLDSLITE